MIVAFTRKRSSCGLHIDEDPHVHEEDSLLTTESNSAARASSSCEASWLRRCRSCAACSSSLFSALKASIDLCMFIEIRVGMAAVVIDLGRYLDTCMTSAPQLKQIDFAAKANEHLFADSLYVTTAVSHVCGFAHTLLPCLLSDVCLRIKQSDDLFCISCLQNSHARVRASRIALIFLLLSKTCALSCWFSDVER
jgi:hypothetical protein